MSDTILVPVTTVQPDLVTQTDVVVYVPLASKTSPGIVQIGEGLNINNGIVSVVPIDVPIMSISKNGTLIFPDENKNVNIVIDKSDVGLSNVDNTSDLDKPISNATQQAINIVKNDVDNLSNSMNTIEINITDVDNKQNLDVITDISITGTGDNRYITSTTKNIKTQVVSTDNDQLTLASDTRAGLMSVSDYQQLRTNTSKIEQLENKTSRLIYDEKSNPTASDINNFAVSEGYEPPFAGLSVVVADTYHIWHYYANVGWKDDGLDIVQQFTNTTAGVIMGSELDGKIYAETDGTGSVNGWGALTGSVSSIDINVTNHINNTQNPHNVTKTQVGLSNVDNTSDIDKPISTAVQSALDLMLPRSEAPTKVSDLKNDAAYIKNNDVHGTVQIPYIYNVQRIYSVEDKDQLYGNPDGKTEIDLSSDSVSIDRRYPNTPTYIPVFTSRRDDVRDVTSIQSASTKRLIVNGAEDPTFPSNSGVLRVVSEDDGSYIEANLGKLTVVQGEDGSNTLHQDSKSLIFNWNGLYLNNKEISPNTIRYDIEQTLTDEQKAQARANIGASSISEGVKLYSSTGQNTDGAMSQKATTDEFAKYLPLTGGDMSGALVMRKETPLRFRYASQYFTTYLIELYGYEDKNHNTSGIFFRSGSTNNSDINNTEITTEIKKFRMIDDDGILYSGGDAYSNKVATMNNLTNYLRLTGGNLTGLVTTTSSFDILNSAGDTKLGSIGAYNNTYISIDANNGIVLSTNAYNKKWFLIIGDDGSLTFQQ